MVTGVFDNVITENSLENRQLNPSLSRQSILRRLTIVIGVALVLVLVGASRYQPLTLNGNVSTWQNTSPEGIVTVSLSNFLTTNGPWGVSVVALRPKVYADPPVHAGALFPCFGSSHPVTSQRCSQNKLGQFI